MNSEQISILIVDDEEDARDLFVDILRQYSLTTAESTVKALAIIENNPPDIVITDVKMPGEGGLVLLSRIKKNFPKIVVIMVTGHGEKSNIIDSIREGVFDYIEKPFSDKELLNSVIRAEKYCKLQKQLKISEAINIQSAKLASIGVLASGVAHELNNPLTTVLGHANLLTTSKNDPAKVEEKAEKIKKAAERMRAIINHLRTFTRESKSTEMRHFDISEPINNALEFLRTQLELQEISINLSLSDSLIPIWGDMTQLESVFQNLLINSRDAFDDVKDNRKKQITITSLVEGKNVIILFEDNATGIPEKIKENIFDPFFTTKETGKGTGLGLSITRNIVDKHNGTISIESNCGKGTKFIIAFPINKNTTENTQSITEETRSQSYSINNNNQSDSINKNKDKPKILVIDDEIDVAAIFCEYVEDSFETRMIADPKNAIELIKKEKFDLILTDLKMPKASGLDILNKTKEFQSNTPVVIMSGFSKHDKDLQYALSQGAKDFLPKPFEDPIKIVNFIENYLNSD